ncbi:hypothetical protein G9H71_22405 [Motilibacter sp. E257]|uniref:BON domain-containing protein n=1 Tax=Motilibacter deserti TaxID=2714956 RepID=A0ABX0GZV5_9ACTN|nr:hypothetical protein [Motilibacter deserti]
MTDFGLGATVGRSVRSSGGAATQGARRMVTQLRGVADARPDQKAVRVVRTGLWVGASDVRARTEAIARKATRTASASLQGLRAGAVEAVTVTRRAASEA